MSIATTIALISLIASILITLIGVIIRLNTTITKLNVTVENVLKITDDHEDRIRTLEQKG